MFPIRYDLFNSIQHTRLSSQLLLHVSKSYAINVSVLVVKVHHHFDLWPLYCMKLFSIFPYQAFPSSLCSAYSSLRFFFFYFFMRKNDEHIYFNIPFMYVKLAETIHIEKTAPWQHKFICLWCLYEIGQKFEIDSIIQFKCRAIVL